MAYSRSRDVYNRAKEMLGSSKRNVSTQFEFFMFMTFYGSSVNYLPGREIDKSISSPAFNLLMSSSYGKLNAGDEMDLSISLPGR
jgi:hypothetical protein